MRDFIQGGQYFLAGFRLIWLPQVRRYVFIPLLINTLLFALAIGFAYFQLQGLLQAMSGWWQWLEWLLWPMFVLVILVVVFFGFSILANLIAAPFNGLLAAAVERRLTGQTVDELNRPLVKEIFLSIFNELNKLLYFLIRAIPLLLLLFIPGMQLLWIIFGAWMLAMEYLDFPMANHGFSFAKVRETVRHRKLLTLGFGISAMLTAMIPLLNFLVMPVAVCGATQLWQQEYANLPTKQGKNPIA